MSRTLFTLLAGVLLFAACQPLRAQDSASAMRLERDVAYLSDRRMEGRLPGTPQSWQAARFIADRMRRLGLLPLDSSYLEPFRPLIRIDTLAGNSLTRETQSYALITDYIPLYFSCRTAQLNAPICWEGFGLADTWHLAAHHHPMWVMMWRGRPPGASGADSLYSDLAKARLAQRLGAAGVLLVNTDTLARQRSELKTHYDELLRLRPRPGQVLSIPVLQLSRNLAQQLLGSWSMDSLEHADASQSLTHTLSASLDLNLRLRDSRPLTANVLGYLPGSDPALKGQFIVLGAHYDHLGYGGYFSGSLKPDTVGVHPGADDNASGTAALLEVARRLTSQRGRLKRSVLFIAFSAEEEGLLGSRYVVEHGPVPTDSIKLMLNMDMVGHLDAARDFYIGGCGTFPQGMDLLHPLAAASPLHTYLIAGGVGGSDHVSFYHHHIPVLGMHTGGLPEYHTPEDDMRDITPRGEALVCDFVEQAVLAASRIPGPIPFVPEPR